MRIVKSVSAIRLISVVAIAIPMMGMSANALAQSSGEVTKFACSNVGGSSSEAAGDREGHWIQTGTYSCKATGGTLDGAVTTGNAVWEQDAGVAKSAINVGVMRKPGGLLAYDTTEGIRTFVMKDGKVAGWVAHGKSVFTAATGSLSGYAGKSFSWTAQATGAFDFSIETHLN